jgi:hypothetical protein
VEFIHNFTFVIKHISGSENKVADSLSRRCLIIQEFQVGTLGFEHLKEMCGEDVDFKEAYEAYENRFLRDRSPWMEYCFSDGFVFKGRKLCIPRCSIREKLLKEKHSGGLARHFGHDKTFTQLSSSYYWPGMGYEVRKFVNKCIIFHYAKERI